MVHCRGPCGGQGRRHAAILLAKISSDTEKPFPDAVAIIVLVGVGTILPRPALFLSVDDGDHNDGKPFLPSPEDNQSHKGPGSAPHVPLDTTKGHRDDEKNNIREQADHGNLTQNTSNRRSG